MVVLAKTDDNWVEQEMKSLLFGEKRLEERVVKIIQDFSQNPTGSIPEFCGDWATTKATYEFCKNPVGARDQIVTARRPGGTPRPADSRARGARSARSSSPCCGRGGPSPR